MANKSNNKFRMKTNVFITRKCVLQAVRKLVLLLGILFAVNQGTCSEAVLTEHQVKALFLFNFTKYVEWPSEAFKETNTPVTIGIVGNNIFEADLKKAVEGKNVNGRSITIRNVENAEDITSCHILFISASEKKRVAD